MIDYTEEDRKLARQIMSDDVLALLRKVFSERYAAEEQSEKTVMALSNERYGEIMKVNFMVAQHTKSALSKLHALARDQKEGRPAIAPK